MNTRARLERLERNATPPAPLDLAWLHVAMADPEARHLAEEVAFLQGDGKAGKELQRAAQALAARLAVLGVTL